MRGITDAIWAEHAGLLLKNIADSQMVIFRDPEKALRACIAAQRAIARHNERLLEADRVYLGCGLGYGEVLKLGDEDVFGVEVNFSAKLGEDLAGPFDIFLTPDCVEAIGTTKEAKFVRVKGGRLGGTKLGYYRAAYELDAPKDPRKHAAKQRVKFK